jgi:hypothetical protein
MVGGNAAGVFGFDPKILAPIANRIGPEPRSCSRLRPMTSSPAGMSTSRSAEPTSAEPPAGTVQQMTAHCDSPPP